MKHLCFSCAVYAALLLAAGAGHAATELKGAEILDHACGKAGVKVMNYLHEGKVAEANKLSTPAMRERWEQLPAKDKAMMGKMAKEMSPSAASYTTAIKNGGKLVVDDTSAKLTVSMEIREPGLTRTSTTSQAFKIVGADCLVDR